MRKIVKVVFWAVIIAIIFIALITGVNIFFFWSAFDWFRGLIVVAGVNPLLAKAIASLLLVIVVTLPIGRMILSFIPIPQKNKRFFRALFFVFAGIFFFCIFLGSRNVFFDPVKGMPLKYYSETNGKIKIFIAPGFDPETGDSLLPVTKEVILRSKGIEITTMKAVPEVPASREISRAGYEALNKKPQFKADTVSGTTVSKKNLGQPVISDTAKPTETFVELLKRIRQKKEAADQKRDSMEKIVTENIMSEKASPAIGYTVAIQGNPNPENLENIFEFRSSRKISNFVCEVTFNNISHGEFALDNLEGKGSFKIPARKKVIMFVKHGDYLLRLVETNYTIPFNPPNLPKLVIKISDKESVPPGQIFAGEILDIDEIKN